MTKGTCAGFRDGEARTQGASQICATVDSPICQAKVRGGSGEGKSMTIAEAKKALAATFGVSPEDVEITIRG